MYKIKIKNPGVYIYIGHGKYFQTQRDKEIITIDDEKLKDALIKSQEAILLEVIEDPKIKAEKARFAKELKAKEAKEKKLQAEKARLAKEEFDRLAKEELDKQNLLTGNDPKKKVVQK